MATTLKQLLEGKEKYFYFAFSLLVGLLFLQHGLQKLFGLFGSEAVELSSTMGALGVIEFTVGILLVLGLLTRLAAMVGAIEMLVVYFTVHFGNGLAPIVNKGELALLYFAAFLILMAYGSYHWGIDSVLFKTKK